MHKPYPKYKPSGVEWIGNIPEGWDVRKIKYLGEAVIGLTYSPQDVVNNQEEGVLVLRSSNIQKGKMDYRDTVYVNKDIPTKLRTRPGDILICARNGSVKLVGKSALIDQRHAGCTFGAFMAILRSKYSEYLNFFIASNVFKAQSGLFSTTTINQLTNTILENTQVSMPVDDKEQQQIANFLDKKTSQIDELIDKKEKMLKLLKEKRSAIINHAVTKGLDQNAKMKPSGIDWIGDIPEGWEVKKLKYQIFLDPPKSEALKKLSIDTFVTFLPMSYVSEDGEIDYSNEKMLEDVYSGYTYFADDDVVVAKITPCFENGKGALILKMKNGIGFGTTEFFVLRSNGINKKHLYYLTISDYFRKIGEACMKGAAGQKRIPDDYIKNFKVCYPGFEQQVDIVSFLDKKIEEIDNLIGKIIIAIKKLHEYRTAIITATVTGKIDIREEKGAMNGRGAINRARTL